MSEGNTSYIRYIVGAWIHCLHIVRQQVQHVRFGRYVASTKLYKKRRYMTLLFCCIILKVYGVFVGQSMSLVKQMGLHIFKMEYS